MGGSYAKPCEQIHNDIGHLISIKKYLSKDFDKDSCKQIAQRIDKIVNSLASKTNYCTQRTANPDKRPQQTHQYHSQKENKSAQNRIHEEIENLRSIQTCLSEGPDKSMRKQLLDNLGGIINKLACPCMEQQIVDMYKKQENVSRQPSSFVERTGTVQITNPTKTQHTCAFVKTLMQILNERLTDFSFIEINDLPDDSIPLIVVCPHLSRQQSDVDQAIGSVHKRRKSPYVVIFRHVESAKNLPPLLCKHDLKLYKDVTFVEMGFKDSGEILPCQHNDEAQKGLMSYLDEFESQRSRSFENQAKPQAKLDVNTKSKFNPNAVEEQRNESRLPSSVTHQLRPVQIKNPAKSESSRAFAKALKHSLEQRLRGIECIESNAELDDNVPLIVVCPHVSRLKPDVDAAIESVQRSSQYVVIILHIGSERDLPHLPSGQKLNGYQNVTFVDMGFNDQGEIFSCEHNREAEVLVRDYFDAFNKQN